MGLASCSLRRIVSCLPPAEWLRNLKAMRSLVALLGSGVVNHGIVAGMALASSQYSSSSETQARRWIALDKMAFTPNRL